MNVGIARETLNDPMSVDDEVHRRIVSWHGTTGGHFDSAPHLVSELLPHMQIHCVRNGKSHYLYCGLETTTTQLFGDEFALAAIGQPGVPDQKFENSLNRDYPQVHKTGQSVCERVSAPISVYGTTFRIEYTRFVFPVYLEGIIAVAVSTRFSDIPALLN